MTQPKLPGRQPGRAAQIAAIHMFADFLAEHPEYPMPQRIMASLLVSDVDEVRRWAKNNGATPYNGQQWVFVDQSIADRRSHGISIVYSMAAELAAAERRAGA